MIAHLREREKNLEPFGWSREDAEVGCDGLSP